MTKGDLTKSKKKKESEQVWRMFNSIDSNPFLSLFIQVRSLRYNQHKLTKRAKTPFLFSILLKRLLPFCVWNTAWNWSQCYMLQLHIKNRATRCPAVPVALLHWPLNPDTSTFTRLLPTHQGINQCNITQKMGMKCKVNDNHDHGYLMECFNTKVEWEEILTSRYITASRLDFAL